MEEIDLKQLFEMSDEQLLKLAGGAILAEGFGGAEITDEDALAEGRLLADELNVRNPKLCEDAKVKEYLHNRKTELGIDLAASLVDVLIHPIVPVPILTLAVIFVRFRLRKICNH